MRIINTNHSPGAIMRFVGVLLFTVFFAGSANAALSGTYTINPAGAASSSNYKTFASAVSDLVSGTRADGGTPNGSGVSGAVIFNVSNGTYTEQITIPAITGTSATNRITFQSASGDSSKVILTQASSTASTNNYTLQLNGADYITFQKITISRTGTSTYGRVIEINNASSYNRFLNISVLGTVQTTSSSTNFTLVYSASGTQDHYNTFRNSLFKYGSYGFYYFGS
ncbi:MAG: hypothetical protein ACXWEY_14465, partial [Bacteroidia bacterium]